MKHSKVFTPEEIKEIRSRISVSIDNTARFIRETRLQHHLSQSSLGSVLYVTKKAVSKWERGLCYPSMDVLPYLAEALGVTTDEILYAKFDTENKYEDNNKTLNLVYRIFRSKQIKMMIKVFIVIALIFLAWFFIENYNAVKIYTLRSTDDYVHLDNALLVTTKQNEYLNLGYMYLDFPDIDENSQVNYTIYVGDKNRIERIVQEFISKSAMLHINNLNSSEFPHIRIDDNFDRIFIDINYLNKNGEAKNYVAKLNVALKYQSNDALNIFKDINEKIIKNIKFPKLGLSEASKIDEDCSIDLSFLYDMTDEERKGKYEDTSYMIENESIKVNINIQKITINIGNIKYRIELNGNLIFIDDYINKKQTTIQIDNKIIHFSQNDYNYYLLLNKIVNILKE